MRILVTGAFGFVGRALTTRLLRNGHDVVAIDNLSKAVVKPGWFDEGRLKTRIEDMRSLEAPRGFDRIVHLAGPVGSFAILGHPCLEREIIGLARHAIQWALSTRTPLMFVSTLEAEDTLVRPPSARHIFVRAKRRAEMEIAFELSRASLPYWIIRPCAISGPYQNADHGFVIPRMLEQAMSGRPVTVFGDGRQAYRVLHVDDLARALEMSLYQPCGVYSAWSPSHCLTLSELAGRVLKLVGSRSHVAYLDPVRAVHPDYRMPFVNQAVTTPLLPDWQPLESLLRILSDTRNSCRIRLCRRAG